MKSKIYIFVEEFSNQNREAFFEKELPYLSAVFKEVIVIPLYPDDAVLNFSAPNVRVENFNFFQPCNRIKILFENFFTVLKIFFFELVKTHNKKYYLKNFFSVLNLLLLRIASAKKIEKQFKQDLKTAVFYTYWFNQWTFAFSIVKRKHKKLMLVSRIHGKDYDESQIKTILPFRYFQLSKVNKLFPVSAYAKKYLERNFKVPSNKIEVSRLGILTEKKLSPVNENTLHIVSCSAIIPLKRVALIVDILKYIGISVKWTHFGDGSQKDFVMQKTKTLGDHIVVDFKGYVPNNEFVGYLKNNPISFFINVSESEGIPVTMMEAIAFGIPLIGTDICGVPEIVTPQTGFLIPVKFSPKDVADLIVREHQQKNIYSNVFRNNVLNFYSETFNQEKNYSLLSTKIRTICAE